MKINRRRKHGAEVSTHSLNDIMFFLLLFFLILSTMAHPNVLKVMLPESKENKAKEAKQNVQVAMDANAQLFYENKIGFSVLASAVLMNILKRQSRH